MSRFSDHSRGYCPYGALPAVGYHHNSYDVIATMRGIPANGYATRFAVLKEYCDLKLARGKTKYDVREKIVALERVLRPQGQLYCRAFDEIREYYMLGPTPFGARSQLAQWYDNVGPQRHNTVARTSVPSRTPSVQVQRANTVLTQSSTTPRARASDEPGDEPPPPPYSSQDPEPEATAVLMAIQRAESNTSAANRTSSEVERLSLSGDAPRPNSFPASPAQRAGNLTASNASGSATPDVSNGTGNRPTTPLDPQERRIREESELEEAMRLSRQSEKERLEYERAVQESIATFEEDRTLRSIQEERYPGESAAGPSSRPTEPEQHQLPGTVEQDGSGHQHTNSQPRANGGGGPHQDRRTVDLMDQFDDMQISSAPLLTPSRQDTAQTPSPGTAQAASHLQSKNPFLSEAERERIMQASPATRERELAARSLAHEQSQHEQNESQQHEPQYGAYQAQQPESHQLEQYENPTERDLPPLPPHESHQFVPPEGPPSGHYSNVEPQYTPPAGPPPGWVPESEGAAYNHPPVPPPPLRTSSGPDTPADRSSPQHQHAYNSPPGARPQQPPALPPRSGTRNSHPTIPPIVVSGETLNVPATMSPGGLSPQTPISAHRSPSPAPILIGGENALEMLREYDTVFLIDDSTSMKGERWAQAIAALMGVVNQAIKYDEDGIDVYFLNSKRVGKGLRTSEDVEELFAGLDPKGATPTGLRMEGILRDYMSRLERATADGESIPAMNLIVITDGAFAVPMTHRLRCATSPDDRLQLLQTAPTDDPESVLISIAKRLDRGDYPLSQVGVQLLQIGDDAEATEALQELDEGLSQAHGVRDMVDTVPYNGEAMSANLIVKVLLGGINRRIDRKF